MTKKTHTGSSSTDKVRGTHAVFSGFLASLVLCAAVDFDLISLAHVIKPDLKISALSTGNLLILAAAVLFVDFLPLLILKLMKNTEAKRMAESCNNASISISISDQDSINSRTAEINNETNTETEE